MAVVVVNRALERLESRAVPVPGHPDGVWPYIYSGLDEVIFADSRSEICDALLDTSGIFDGEEKSFKDGDLMMKRESYLRWLGARYAHERPSTYSEEDLDEIYADRDARRFEDLSSKPMVVMATDYKPFTEVERPDWEHVMLNPYTETTFLNSVCDLLGTTLVVNESASSEGQE